MFDASFNESGSMTMPARFDLFQRLLAVSGALRAQWDRELRAQLPELGAARAAVILQLGRSGGASQTRLSRLLGHNQMTVSRLLDNLERRGLVHREAMPTERRTWAARLTDDGRRVLFAIHTAQLAFVNRICSEACCDCKNEGTFKMMFGLTLLRMKEGAQAGGRTRPQVALD
ncbi:MAG TPA: MarR family winged helix-turn-helix transcriptional regulator [Rhizomicrobium sp.]|nr:MarR family winged helix-turn-helix transcriptional regulator [Rhizomicrobium sp.]